MYTWCLKVISWKHSFNRLNEENEIAKKKKQALDGLYEKGKISQSTHDSFNADIAAAITEIEKQQQELIGKMTTKTVELHGQIKTLEILLANYEIQHVAGEIDENTYTLEINLLTKGLETAKHELETIQNAVTQLSNPIVEPTAQPAAIPTMEVAPIQPQEIIEVAVAAAPVEIAPAQVFAAPEPIFQETIADPIVEAPAIVEQPAAIVAEAEIVQATPEPIVEEPATIIEQPVIVEQPAVVVEAPIVEAPIVEAPIVEAPGPVIEQPVAETPTVEVPFEQPPVGEAEVVEQPTEETVEIAAPEPVAVEEEAKIEKPALDQFEVAEADVVQKELLQAVEEITENPFPEAPQEAHAEATVETPAEVSVETQPVSIHTAKESLPEISSSDSENKE
jgi:hypothetical protein